jgi:hypothetical protein|tara:strand:+ start:498 stop:827 length:330 start_codon:yes stop_codon:yes gene_type:complete
MNKLIRFYACFSHCASPYTEQYEISLFAFLLEKFGFKEAFLNSLNKRYGLDEETHPEESGFWDQWYFDGCEYRGFFALREGRERVSFFHAVTRLFKAVPVVYIDRRQGK